MHQIGQYYVLLERSVAPNLSLSLARIHFLNAIAQRENIGILCCIWKSDGFELQHRLPRDKLKHSREQRTFGANFRCVVRMAGCHNVNNHVEDLVPESVASHLGSCRTCFFCSHGCSRVNVPGFRPASNSNLQYLLRPNQFATPAASTTPKSTMPRHHEDPDWVWRCHPNHRSPPGNGNADVNNPVDNITCPSVMYLAALAFCPTSPSSTLPTPY